MYNMEHFNVSRHVILLTGQKQNGKDTCALFFESVGYKQYALADLLKRICSVKYSLPLNLFYESKETELSDIAMSPRKLMILEGTFTRSIMADAWIKALMTTIISENHKKIVITDCRYQNEVDLLSQLGTTNIIRIVRPGFVSNDEPDAMGNISKVDFIINNNGTVPELHRQMRSVLSLCTIPKLIL